MPAQYTYVGLSGGNTTLSDTNINFRGEWSETTSYSVLDSVVYTGRRFIAVAAHTGVTPPSTLTNGIPEFWSPLVLTEGNPDTLDTNSEIVSAEALETANLALITATAAADAAAAQTVENSDGVFWVASLNDGRAPDVGLEFRNGVLSRIIFTDTLSNVPGDPPFNYPGVPGGPVLLPTNYELRMTSTIANGTWTNTLVWTYPYAPGIDSGVYAVLPLTIPISGIFLQRSTVSAAMPNDPNNLYEVTSSLPPVDSDWTTVHTFGPYAHFSDAYLSTVADPNSDLDSSSNPYVDVVSAPPGGFYSYRLMMIMGNVPNRFELDWNAVVAVQSYVLSGSVSGNTASLSWTAPTFSTGFTLYRATTLGVWVQRGSTISGNVRAITDDVTGISSPFYYRLVGHGEI